jgi:hypothetical protein
MRLRRGSFALSPLKNLGINQRPSPLFSPLLPMGDAVAAGGVLEYRQGSGLLR